MAKKIYVGNLSFDTNDEQLNQIFTPYGAVASARVIKDKYTDRSRGFGFVEMDNVTRPTRRSPSSTARTSKAAPSRSARPRPARTSREAGAVTTAAEAGTATNRSPN